MSLTKENTLYAVSGLSEIERVTALSFLQGAVYCWCKNRPDEWFALRDLVGGDNTHWSGTPLMPLYEKHSNLSDAQAFEAAAKDVGWLLKHVVVNDIRVFETKKAGLVRQYKWQKFVPNA
ncbi:conserved hypothetical protein [Pseudomonas sp. 8BK]|uniref:hypothetical protein n=1 Tax=Pseudomonas sp. 8BK TaxID=2653164 RepID=UPI0012F0F525|nr:hypothetical protein [Pseudomonas sp. 8BK]VXC45896.1 conserved hypothetical protein [Pseudomonas sp. 8BK]